MKNWSLVIWKPFNRIGARILKRWHVCRDGDDKPVCVVHDSSDGVVEIAHMIAAAPQLYAALDKARMYIGDCDLPDLIAQVDAALKKARGE